MLDVLIITLGLTGLLVVGLLWNGWDPSHFDHDGTPRYGSELLDLADDAHAEWNEAAA